LQLSEGNYDKTGNHPVVYVSWHEALEYCNWLQEKLVGYAKVHFKESNIWQTLAEGSVRVGLPNEAQWEKASRGTTRRIFPWRNRINIIDGANIEMNIGSTSPVGCFPKGTSPYGVMDMAGNIWEWTRSIWGNQWSFSDFIYPYNPDDGRENLGSRGFRILRGGCFLSSRKSSRCSSRLRLNPTNKDDHIGFRVAIS
jgi:formylglycine-generating enzyme required for sulfatase activity